jgi:hypothetical protein
MPVPLLIIFVALFFAAVALCLVPWMTHIEMVHKYTDKNANGNFEQFLREFNSRSWERKDRWRQSYFGIEAEYYTNEIHADVIKFDEVGMILDPISYFRFKIWSQKNAIPRSNNSKEYKGYWSKNHE